MAELIQQNWIFLVIALVVGLIVAWWIFAANRRTTVTLEKPEEDQPAAAKRNQALIDAPPAASADSGEDLPPVTPVGMAGVGEAVAAAARPVHVESSHDELTRIKGIGPKLAQQLHDLGITHFTQIADWDDAEIDRIDAQLGRFQGRIRRDNWPEQARLLSSGDKAGYEAKFGKL
ncbi:putative flap endonuclease-1-like 5' DNA nuclease [Altererythrobacter atlanticus]|uniref:NADH dehydrogenase subunit E n=1 Tax=Croceibacterium atlanticum TaxID=1267766 RepID=A0A0F7KYE4_9SPHN|nr:hypothetical protein [Croceibacterium atlanticum]AKH44247.1 NADH dehydrogenase subunit E [Croceibacterium atlanticum]MBB5732558.1 putative flap endonuclease-1-like 5' DNA nuclease [Croceibacterium atlanticum]